MQLKQILAAGKRDKLEIFMHLERYVNEGSPSGFTQIHKVQDTYSPFSLTRSYRLPIFNLRASEVFKASPSKATNSFFEGKLEGNICLHPQMQELYFPNKNPDQYLEVMPTSSSRTVLVVTKSSMAPLFLKLHFRGLLGRIFRALNKHQIVAGIEISREFNRLFSDNALSLTIAILPETIGAVFFVGGEDIGYIIREFNTRPYQQNTFLIPWFSLFSNDQLWPKDSPLLPQILTYIKDGKKIRDVFLERFISPLLESFADIVMRGGFIFDYNAQNLFWEYSKTGNTRIVYRDLHSARADTNMRKANRLSHKFTKTLNVDNPSEQGYQLRSFYFDSKFVTYVLDPIVDLFCSTFRQRKTQIRRAIRLMFLQKFSVAKEYFKPYNRAYRLPKKIITTEEGGIIPFIESEKSWCR